MKSHNYALKFGIPGSGKVPIKVHGNWGAREVLSQFCGQFGSNKVFFKKKSRATGYDIITIGAEK